MSKDEQKGILRIRRLRLVPTAEQEEQKKAENRQEIAAVLRDLVARVEAGDFCLVGYVAAKSDGTVATMYAGDLVATADLNLAIDILKDRVLRHE